MVKVLGNSNPEISSFSNVKRIAATIEQVETLRCRQRIHIYIVDISKSHCLWLNHVGKNLWA